ncbi:MAG: hypothetical protein PV344_03110 [Anaplasma sp.]|nr:hypothetical protein [Anaplasma sp.]
MRGLVSSVPGSQPKGRGIESRLKFFKFLLKENDLLYKVKSFETHVIFYSLSFHA